MVTIANVDIETDIATQVAAVAAAGGAVEIRGGGSKNFYGEAVEGLVELLAAVAAVGAEHVAG